MRRSKIFISYRRADNSGTSARIHEQFVAAYGKDKVFFDSITIPPGADFSQFIQQYIAQCAIMLVIIGKQWLATQADGSSRLADPQDFVRLEIEAAFNQGVVVIPVLIDDAILPDSAQLPESLHRLLRLNAAPIPNGQLFVAGINHLIERCDKHMPGPVRIRRSIVHRFPLVTAVVSLILAVFLLMSLNPFRIRTVGQSTTSTLNGTSTLSTPIKTAGDANSNLTPNVTSPTSPTIVVSPTSPTIVVSPTPTPITPTATSTPTPVPNNSFIVETATNGTVVVLDRLSGSVITTFGITPNKTVIASTISNGMIYLMTDDNTIHALNLSSQREVWNFPNPNALKWGGFAPMQIAVTNGKLIYWLANSDNTCSVEALNLSNPTKPLSFKLPIVAFPACPLSMVVDNGYIFVGAHTDPHGDAIYALSTDTLTLKPNWSNFAAGGGGILLSYNHILFGVGIYGEEGGLIAMSEDDGKQLWNFGQGQNLCFSAFSNILTENSSGFLITLDPNTGNQYSSPLSFIPPSGTIWLSTTSSNFFLAAQGTLYALDFLGNVQWKVTILGDVVSPMQIFGGVGFFSTHIANGVDTYVFAVSLSTGSILWQKALPNNVFIGNVAIAP